MGIVLAILVFGTVIFVHEMGHFLLAKANKIRVNEFSGLIVLEYHFGVKDSTTTEAFFI